MEQTIYFDSDGYRLVGTLQLPDTPYPPVIIGSHGLLANRHSMKQISLASACNRNDVAYFRFDHRGCGDSQGEFGKVTSLAARRQDLFHAIRTLEKSDAVGPLIGLFGSSFGGTVVLAYAAEYEAPALITYAAPINSTSINHSNIRDNNGRMPPSSQLTDALTFDLSASLKRVNDILVSHSQNDETVPEEHAELIYESVDHPKQKVVFEGGDHRMSDIGHQQRFEKIFIDWFVKRRSQGIAGL